MRPDNFTPPTRTPWGGRVLIERFKCDLVSAQRATHPVVGESWEVSVEPSFPSYFADGDADGDGRLDRAIAEAPVTWLGAAQAERFGGQTPLLIKLLDADDNLSVQVHPDADDPALAADESGKPEGWYVLAAAAGAGLYLGFRDGVDPAEVERCVRTGGSLDQLLNFVPVVPGDAFVIPAGTVHAVGAGVTLYEPQLVRPGRRAVTYRFWDWNRTYDGDGKIAKDGIARPLHVERSLACTDWRGPRGRELVTACRASVSTIERGSLTRERVLSWDHFTVERWFGCGELTIATEDNLLALTCIAGAAELRCEAGATTLVCGQSAVVPAGVGTLRVHARSVEAGDALGPCVDILASRA